jgi:hypothetical protein
MHVAARFGITIVCAISVGAVDGSTSFQNVADLLPAEFEWGTNVSGSTSEVGFICDTELRKLAESKS